MDVYRKVMKQVPVPVARDTAIAYLNKKLPEIWASQYSGGGKLLTVTIGGKNTENGAVSTLFDLQAKNSATDDRVVAVWGLSKSTPGSTRDKNRIGQFLKNVWSDAYAGRDRGHFFAHTMGGGLDINLFPQLANINRNPAGEWRRMEIFAAENTGTFCFIRPIYKGQSWTPAELEYGIYTLPPDNAFTFWGNVFPN